MEKKRNPMTIFVRLITLLLLSGLIYFIFTIIERHEEKKPKVVNEIQGIKINEKLADTLFKNEGYKIQKSNGSENKISYINDETKMEFSITDGLISNIFFACLESDTSTTIEGIECNDSSEKIIEKYGNEVKVFCDNKDDEFKTRLYDVEKYGISFGLYHNKVEVFIVFEPYKMIERKNEHWTICE